VRGVHDLQVSLAEQTAALERLLKLKADASAEEATRVQGVASAKGARRRASPAAPRPPRHALVEGVGHALL
jgi:hypothetical protein